MNRRWLAAAGFLLCDAAIAFASTQTDYMSGGVGEEDRARMMARQGEFALKVVLSDPGGDYVVADKLSISTPQGEVLMTIRDAGPIVMIKLRPGQYTLEASWQGKTERRPVRVADSAQSLNWRLPG
jgi:hypothetical protein